MSAWIGRKIHDSLKSMKQIYQMKFQKKTTGHSSFALSQTLPPAPALTWMSLLPKPRPWPRPLTLTHLRKQSWWIR